MLDHKDFSNSKHECENLFYGFGSIEFHPFPVMLGMMITNVANAVEEAVRERERERASLSLRWNLNAPLPPPPPPPPHHHHPHHHGHRNVRALHHVIPSPIADRALGDSKHLAAVLHYFDHLHHYHHHYSLGGIRRVHDRNEIKQLAMIDLMSSSSLEIGSNKNGELFFLL